jgi:hypothetical protein
MSAGEIAGIPGPNFEAWGTRLEVTEINGTSGAMEA